MSRKVYLFAGHSASDAGAIGYDGTKESQLTQVLRNGVWHHLWKWGKGIDAVRDLDAWSLPKAVAYLRKNAKPNDLLVEFHFNHNHPTASGTEAFVHRNTSPENAQLASKMTSALASIMGIPDRGVKTEEQSARGRIGILHAPPRVILLEVCFLNHIDLPRYAQHQGEVAKAIADLIQATL